MKDINLESQNSKGYLPRGRIPWTESLCSEVLSFFQKIDYPFRYSESIPFKGVLQGEIRRFLVSLDAYIESPNPVIPYRRILYGAAHKGFAQTLKRIKQKSIYKSWYADSFGIPDWWDEIDAYEFKDIGDIFNYNYLIFWEEDEPDDYLYGNIPVDIDSEYLECFRREVAALLPPRDKFDMVDPSEILFGLSSSMSYDGSKKSPHFKIKTKHLKFSKRRHPGLRSIIHVGPENIRDSVIVHIEDLNTISLIDAQMMNILSVMGDHIHLRDKNRIARKLKRFNKRHDHFLQRDFQKEGITKPRALLKVMLQELHTAYPDIEVFGYTEFYDEYDLIVEDQIHHLERGHGLGMANCLTTLMQMAIHQIVLDEMSFIKASEGIGILVLNDDFVAGFTEPEDLDEYWDAEDTVLSKLSIIRQPNKSFRTDNRFILAERYVTPSGEHEKTSYQLRELMYPLTCYNISHAKEYYNAAQIYCSSKFEHQYLSEICTFWGYEFHPREINYPAICGGWVNDKINTVDMSLVLMERLGFDEYMIRGFHANNYRPFISDRGGTFISPIYELYARPKIPEEFRNHFDILPESQIMSKYGKNLKDSNTVFCQYWDRMKINRQKIFKKRFSSTFSDFIEEVVNHFDNINFFPCEEMISSFHSGDYFKVKIRDPYLDPNPRVALLSYYNDIQYDFKDRFSICFTDADISTKKSNSIFSIEIQRSLKSDLLQRMLIGREHEILYPSDGYKPEEDYLNAVRIGEVSAILCWGKGYPEIHKRFRNPLIERKREIFGTLFSLQELDLITESGISRVVLKLLLESEIITGSVCERIKKLSELALDLREIPSIDPLEMEYDEESEHEEEKFFDYPLRAGVDDDHDYEYHDPHSIFITLPDLLPGRGDLLNRLLNEKFHREFDREAGHFYQLTMEMVRYARDPLLANQAYRSPEILQELVSRFGGIALVILRGADILDENNAPFWERDPFDDDISQGGLFQDEMSDYESD